MRKAPRVRSLFVIRQDYVSIVTDDETDKSRRLTSDMMACLSGVRGMKSVSLLNANRRYDLGPTSQRDARDGMHEKGSIDAESGRPVYRLRRMVPPGRYVIRHTLYNSVYPL